MKPERTEKDLQVSRSVHAVRCCVAAVLFVAPVLYGARPYTPSLGDPVGQTACWRGIPGVEGIRVLCACEQQDGAILFGTQKVGVLRYDGVRVEKLGLVNSRVWAIRTTDGGIYVGTDDGLFLRQGSVWKQLSAKKRVLRIRAFGSGICAITPDALEVGAAGTVRRPGSFKPVDVIDVGDGRLWVLDGSGRLATYCDSEWRDMPDVPLLPAGSGTFAKDLTGGIWLLHESRKLIHWQTPQSRCEVMNITVDDAVIRTSGFAVTADGNVWIGTSSGLAVLRKSGWYTYQSRGTLVPPALNGILETRSGLWLYGNEVRRLDHMGKRQQFFYALSLQAESAGGTQWFVRQNIGSEVVRRDGARWTLFNNSDGLMDDPRAVFVTRDDTVWAIGAHREQVAAARFNGAAWELHLCPNLRGSFDRARIYEEESGDLYVLAIGMRGWPRRNWQSLVISQHGDELDWSRPDLDTGDSGLLPGNETWLRAPSLRRLSDSTREAFLRNETLAEAIVNTIYAGTDGSIWVGTDGSGLLRFDGAAWSRFDAANGLPGSQIHGVLELADGSMIAGSLGDGFSRRDPASTRWWRRDALIPRFDAAKSGGREHSLYQTHDGAVWLITRRGTLRHVFETAAPETMLIGRRELVVEQSDLVVTWQGVDRWNETRPADLQFSYRLDNTEWSPFTGSRQQILSGMEAGHHSFEIRARDRDLNIDSTPALLRLTVQLPMWRRPWFLGLMALMLSIIVALVVLLIRARLRQIVEIERLKAVREQEVNEMKLRFFVNVSHEFRTPLTLILGPLERMLSKGEIEHEQGAMIYRNARRLLQLVNELLDFRQLESGQLRITPKSTDVVAFLQDLVRTFHSQAEARHIEVILNCDVTILEVEFDRDKMEKILMNLVGNAMKFTQPPGRVVIGVAESDAAICITVSDTGCGIPAEEVSHVVDRFYQGSRNGGATGTGIGLSLTKELVELHGGSIEVESTEGCGTTFMVSLPRVAVSPPGSAPPTGEYGGGEIPGREPETQSNEATEELPLILIVEDNEDMREFLHVGLDECCQVVEAEDGMDGWEVAKARMPELIVSDVMMPRMDGLEFAAKLRAEPLTSHIPIIMLTARASEEHEIEGLRCGVDDYIRKPFSMPVLKARIANLLESRRRLFELYRSNPEDSVNAITENPLDREFLERVTSIVEEHMAKTEFGTGNLVALMHMERTTLYRKLKGLTGQSTSVFIRSIRLKHAARLLRDGAAVSDAAYGVGIENLSYFSKCFKEQFGVTPAEYRKGESSAQNRL